MSGPNDLDLPFENNPQPTDVDMAHGHFAGGLVVMAAMLPIVELGTVPALVYRFAKPDGSGFYPPMILVVDEDQLRKTVELTQAAITAAIEAVG